MEDRGDIKKGGPMQTITYLGETLPYPIWADRLGIKANTMMKRLRKYKKGTITLDDVMKSERPLSHFAQPGFVGNPMSKGTAGPIGVRSKTIAALFDAFYKWGVPLLDNEVKNYMQTREIGPAMAFFQKYQGFFPKDKIEALDGETKANIAQFAVINMPGQIPANFKVIE